jgi:hypothetical protein
MMRLSCPGPRTVTSQLKSDIWCNRRWCYKKLTVTTIIKKYWNQKTPPDIWG